MSVRWIWSGAVTDDGFSVTSGLEAGDDSCRLAVSTAADMSNPVYGPVTAPSGDFYLNASITGLQPATQYWYQIEIDGVLDAGMTGKCKTFPVPGEQYSINIAFASCSPTGSSSLSFEGIANSGADLFLHLGDKHYGDIGVDDEQLFIDEHELNFAQARQRAFHESMPVAYVWSDHDYGPNNSDRTSPSRPAAASSYRKLVPHWGYQDDIGIWQSFRIGRILVIYLDERSYRDANESDPPNKTMLGTEQKEWLREVCLNARTDGTAMILLASDQELNMGESVIDEHWGKYPEERDEVGDILLLANVPIVAISGDEHRSAFTRSYMFGNSQMMICHHGTINSSDPVAVFGVTSLRGIHNWDWGTEHHKGFGHLEIKDVGEYITVRFKVNSVNQTTGVITVPFDSGDVVIKDQPMRAEKYIANHPAMRRSRPLPDNEGEPIGLLLSLTHG